MRAALLEEPGRVVVADVPEPVIVDPRDVIVDIRFAGVCGSDLWPYRGLVAKTPGSTSGHEFLGVVRELGAEVRGLAVGDAVIAPFLFSDGDCEACDRGLTSLCARGGMWGKDAGGGQAERIRVPFGDATLMRLPWAADELDGALARALMPITDVFATGTHGATLAEIGDGDAVVVIGDGAVGISAGIAARRQDAGSVLVVGENPARLAVASDYGLDVLHTNRGDDAVGSVLASSGGRRPDRVIECVGVDASFASGVELVRDGGRMSFVGVPHGVAPIAPMRLFARQISLVGGVAPARHYLPGLVEEVRSGVLDLAPLVEAEYALSEVADAYAAMDSGEALKVILDVSR